MSFAHFFPNWILFSELNLQAAMQGTPLSEQEVSPWVFSFLDRRSSFHFVSSGRICDTIFFCVYLKSFYSRLDLYKRSETCQWGTVHLYLYSFKTSMCFWIEIVFIVRCYGRVRFKLHQSFLLGACIICTVSKCYFHIHRCIIKLQSFFKIKKICFKNSASFFRMLMVLQCLGLVTWLVTISPFL